MIATATTDTAAIEEHFRAQREVALTAVPLHDLLTLVAAPFWTRRALHAVGIDVDSLLERADALIAQDGFDDDMTVTVAQSAAPAVFLRLELMERNERASRLASVARQLRLALATDPSTAPRVLAAWAELAALDSGIPGAVNLLLARVRTHCEQGSLGRATEYAEAARPLARVVWQLRVAERLARYRISREFRAQHDRTQLSFYVRRAEANAAFDQLLAPDGPWALHFVGVGGAGKTTFIRHLAVQRAAELKIPVARIDFDFLSPAYPGRDPGQLVQAIVHELSVQIDDAAQDSWNQSIAEQLARLREVARDARPDDPIGPIAWPEFQELLSFVASFLASLGRPLLILDTCEELMKLPVVGTTIPSVEATFRLIEELHSRVPALRVVFAGRRLLARGGDGWTAPARTHTQALSAPRPYLALHELRGMPDDEAREVLAQLLPEARRADAALVDAILAKCPEDGRVAALDTDGDAGARRYSPFRLTRYAHWVAAEPTLAPERLDQGAEPYIEQRIVQRIGALDPHLCTVMQLRRFDAATLAAARGISMNAAESVVRELAGHEWVYAFDLVGRGIVVAPKGSIRDELVAYLRARRPDAWEAARAAIGAALGGRLAEPGAVALQPELIDAALRALPEADAVRAWFALEARIGSEWSTALALTRFLTGDGNAADRESSVLGVAVRATQASALIHDQPEVDVGPLWTQLAEAMAAAPQTETAVMLRSRARLGAVSAAGWRGTNDADVLARELFDAIAKLGPKPPPTSCTWVVSAVEGLLERLERDYTTCARLGEIADGTHWLPLPGASTEGLAGFASILCARAAVLLGRANVQVTRAASTLPETCVDWLPPASLGERVELELLRLRFWGSAATFAKSGAGWSGAVDADRAFAAAFQREAAERWPRTSIAPRPPPFATRSWGLREPAAYRRFPTAAFAAEVMNWQSNTYSDSLTDAERLRILYSRARRRRDPAIVPSGATARASSESLFISAARAAAVVLGRSEPIAANITDARALIAHWSYQCSWTGTQHVYWNAGSQESVERMRPHVEDLRALAAADGRHALGAYVTLEELATISARDAEPIRVDLEPPAQARVHPDDMESVLRFELRLAVRGERFEPRPRVTELAARLPHLLGRLAIEEAELLALRLPRRALALFAFADETLTACGDPASAMIARLGRHEIEPLPSPPKLEDVPPALRVFAARVLVPAPIIEPSGGPPPRVGPPLGVVPQFSPRKKGVRPTAAGGAVGVASAAFMVGQGVATWKVAVALGGWFVVMFLVRLFAKAEPKGRQVALPPVEIGPAPAATLTLDAEGTDSVKATLGAQSWTLARPRIGETPELPTEIRSAAQPLRLVVARELTAFAWEAALPGLAALRPTTRAEAPTVEGKKPSWSIEQGPSVQNSVLAIGKPSRKLGGIDLLLGDGAAIVLPSIVGTDVVLRVLGEGTATAATRTEIGMLRELALGLIERGAHSVIVLPPGERAPALTALATALASSDPRPLDQLLSAARAARAALPSPLADEVTLFFAEPPR